MSNIIAAQTAGQFIPFESFRAHQRTPKSVPDFTRFLLDICEWVEEENKSDELRRHRKWVKAHMYYEARQLGQFGRGGQWRDVEALPTDPYYVDNKFRFFAKSVRKEWVRSNPEFIARGRNGTMESDGAARAAKAIMHAEVERLWTPALRQREATFAILTGNYFRYTYFNANKGRSLDIPVFEQQQAMVGADEMVCYDCGTAIPTDPAMPIPVEEMICPECGSPNVEATNAQPVSIPAQTGMRQQMSGEVEFEVIDPMEIKLHLHARSMEESPYLRRMRYVLKDAIEATYPWVKFSEGEGKIMSGLWLQNELERSAGNTTGQGHGGYGEAASDRHSRMVEMCQYWFEPTLYSTYVLEKDLPLATGETIPAGEMLIDLFPNGMYVAKVGQAFVDIRDEKRSNHWLHGQYDVIPTRVWADGNEDAIEQQRQHNEVSSLIFTNIMNCDAPSTIYNPLKISRSQFSGKPQEMVPLKNATLADEPQKYIWQPNPRPVGGEPVNYRMMLEQSMQSGFGAFNSVNGLPDADNKTATGISIVRDAATSLLGVPLEIRAYVDMQQGIQIIRMKQENWQDEIDGKLLGDHGMAEAEWFKVCDIDNDIQMTVRPNSHIPRDEAQLRNDIIEGLTVGGIPLGVYSPMFPPEARAEAMKRLNLPFDADKQQIHTRNQYLEIMAILEAVNMASEQNMAMGLPPEGLPLAMPGMGGPEGQGGPEEEMGSSPQEGSEEEMAGGPAGAGMPPPMLGIDPVMASMQAAPVQPDIDEHAYHIEEVKRYLNTDKGKQAFPYGSPQYTALIMHLQMHKQAMQMQMMEQMMMQGAAQAMGGEPGGEGGPPGGGKPGKAGKPAEKKENKGQPRPPKNGEQG